MLLNDFTIKMLCQNAELVAPYNDYHVNPASIDLRLSRDIIEIDIGGINDAGTDRSDMFTNQRKVRIQPNQRYLLLPGKFVLAASLEYVKMPTMVGGLVTLKSTSARRGIGHAYAGWIDPGFQGNITFELFSHVPVELRPEMPIVQMLLLQMASAPIVSYDGRYQHQTGPTAARYVKQTELPGMTEVEPEWIGHEKVKPITTLDEVKGTGDWMEWDADDTEPGVLPGGIINMNEG